MRGGRCQEPGGCTKKAVFSTRCEEHHPHRTPTSRTDAQTTTIGDWIQANPTGFLVLDHKLFNQPPLTP